MKFNKLHAAVVAALSGATGLYSGTASAQLEEIIVKATSLRDWKLETQTDYVSKK